MGARNKTEEVLKKIHVYLATAEPYPGSSRKVVVDKNDFLGILKELNVCMSEMIEEYEASENSRDKAEREHRKKSEELKKDAKRDAEDIYAASIMYTDQALRRIQDAIDEARVKMGEVMTKTDDMLREQRQVVKSNQLELISRLEGLKDTDKYMRLITDENIRIQKELEKAALEAADAPTMDPEIYDRAKPEIRINTEYLDRLGLDFPEQGDEEEEGNE